MKTKILLIKIISMAMIIMLVLFNYNFFSMATSESSLKNQQSAIEDKIDELEDEKSEITASKTEALKSISSLTTKINEYESQIDSLNTKIDELNKSINESEKKIEEATKEYNRQSDLLDARLLTMYQAGQTSYLDVILCSKDISELISNYHLISILTESDTSLLEKIQKQKTEIENAKAELEESKASIENAKTEKVTKSNELKNSKAEKSNLVNKLSEEEKSIQEQLDQFEEDKKAIQKQLEELSRKYTNVTEPSACGYIFPVAGLTRANIRVKTYPSYSGHTGVDVNINVVGKTVVAVKSGTVVTSTALKNPNGTYRSYGEYIIIDHHDGTMTLYAHGLAGSRKVSPGQKVTQGQALMTVGSTGNSTGTHLHFEVRVGGRPVNPFPYLP